MNKILCYILLIFFFTIQIIGAENLKYTRSLQDIQENINIKKEEKGKAEEKFISYIIQSSEDENEHDNFITKKETSGINFIDVVIHAIGFSVIYVITQKTILHSTNNQ